MANINGQEYGWEDVQIVVQGKASPLTGVQGVEYKSTKEHINVMGRGNKPVSMARGPEGYEGSLTILQSELEAMQDAFGSEALTTRPAFDIAVSYAPLVGAARTDLLKGCRINEVSKAFKNEDGNMVIELPLKIFRIEYNRQ